MEAIAHIVSRQAIVGKAECIGATAGDGEFALRASRHRADCPAAAGKLQAGAGGVGGIVEGEFFARSRREAIAIDITAAAQAGLYPAASAEDSGVGGIVVWLLHIAGNTVFVGHQELILVGGRRQVRFRDGDRVIAAGAELDGCTIGQGRCCRDDGARRAIRRIECQVVIRWSGGQIEGHGLSRQAGEGVHIDIIGITERTGDGDANAQSCCRCQRAVADAGCVVAVHRATGLVTGVGWRRHIAQCQRQFVLAAILHGEAAEDQDSIDGIRATRIGNDAKLIGQACVFAKGRGIASGVEDDQAIVGGQLGERASQGLLVWHCHGEVICIGWLVEYGITDRTIGHRLGDDRERGCAADTIVRFIAVRQRTGAEDRCTVSQHEVGSRRTQRREQEAIGVQVARSLILAAESSHGHAAAAIQGGAQQAVAAAVIKFVGKGLRHQTTAVGSQPADDGGCAAAIAVGFEQLLLIGVEPVELLGKGIERQIAHLLTGDRRPHQLGVAAVKLGAVNRLVRHPVDQALD